MPNWPSFGGWTVQSSKHFESSRRFPTLASVDRDFVREDELAPDVDEFASDEYEESKLEPEPRWLPRLLVLFGMAVAGVVLALIWHNVKPNLSFASLPTQTTSTPAAPGLVQDLEALKKIVTELRDTQQQLVAKVAALEVAKHHMQQELASHTTGAWYSDSKILMYRTATAQPPKPPSPAKPKPRPQSLPHSQDANASQPNGSPLPLPAGRP